jgi:UDP-N-acetylglucosamine acyltransferase
MISPLASIHPDAKLGRNTVVEPFAYIQADVVIGDDCWIGPNTVIMDGARIGNRCKVFPGAVISAVPQDLKFSGEVTTTEIGDNTTIRECVTLNRGTVDKHKTVIGSNCLLMAYVHVGHDSEVGDNVILANSVNISGHVIIEDWAILEGYVGVGQFVHIGAHAFIGGQTGVRKNVPPFVKAAREPLAYVGVNSIGLSRRGYSREQVLRIEDIYRTLYVKGLNVSNALGVIEKEAPEGEEKEQILKFIRSSKDGIIRGLV